MERPKRNARKKPDPNFVFSATHSPRKHSSGGKNANTPPQTSPIHSSPTNAVTSPTQAAPIVTSHMVTGALGSGIKQPLCELQTPTQPNKPSSADVKHATTDTPRHPTTTVTSTTSRTRLSTSTGKKAKSCARANCPELTPICFAGAAQNCARNGYTSRWYHISAGEHFCNECFEHYYRPQKPGHGIYNQWRQKWTSNSKLDPSQRLYMMDEHLPYWLQCTADGCGKWKQVNVCGALTTQLVTTYRCSMRADGTTKDGNKWCTFMQDQRVTDVHTDKWLTLLFNAPYLQNSPAEPYLMSYYPDGVGISPTHITVDVKIKKEKECSTEASAQGEPQRHIDKFLQPFHEPYEPLKAGCIRPDVMEADELKQFPQYAGLPVMYLGLRNLIIALWSKNTKEWLTIETCLEHLFCRGLARIRLVQDLPSVLQYCTASSYINIGILDPVPGYKITNTQGQIIVIGAGPSGIATAYQLQKYGAKVRILEARDRIGGRVYDTQLGVTVGQGAQILIGSTNNPLTILCHQLDLPFREIVDECELLDECGRITYGEMDKRIDIHFNALLDNIADWRRNKVISEDRNLLDKIREIHQQFLDESHHKFSEEESRLLEFHLGNLEYACGRPLNHVSALMWDHNEQLAQYGGPHLMLTNGYTALFNHLAKCLDITLNSPVHSIDYSDSDGTTDTCTVHYGDGETVQCTQVVVTVPLTCLKRDTIRLTPAIPDDKQMAINHLGAGIIEKVGLRFPHRFWDDTIKHADVFGNVPKDADSRGLFNVFYDMAPKSDIAVLMTYVSGKIVSLIKDKSDNEVITVCMNVLRRIFPDKDVPDPIDSFISRWQNDEYAGMSYTFMPVGCPPIVYEKIAQPMNNTVFFAGEATNRQFPQTVTGAYLSGIREANRLLSMRGGCMKLNQMYTGITEYRTLADYKATTRNITKQMNMGRKRRVNQHNTNNSDGTKAKKVRKNGNAAVLPQGVAGNTVVPNNTGPDDGTTVQHKATVVTAQSHNAVGDKTTLQHDTTEISEPCDVAIGNVAAPKNVTVSSEVCSNSNSGGDRVVVMSNHSDNCMIKRDVRGDKITVDNGSASITSVNDKVTTIVESEDMAIDNNEKPCDENVAMDTCDDSSTALVTRDDNDCTVANESIDEMKLDGANDLTSLNNTNNMRDTAVKIMENLDNVKTKRTVVDNKDGISQKNSNPVSDSDTCTITNDIVVTPPSDNAGSDKVVNANDDDDDDRSSPNHEMKLCHDKNDSIAEDVITHDTVEQRDGDDENNVSDGLDSITDNSIDECKADCISNNKEGAVISDQASITNGDMQDSLTTGDKCEMLHNNKSEVAIGDTTNVNSDHTDQPVIVNDDNITTGELVKCVTNEERDIASDELGDETTETTGNNISNTDDPDNSVDITDESDAINHTTTATDGNDKPSDIENNATAVSSDDKPGDHASSITSDKANITPSGDDDSATSQSSSRC